MSRIPGHKTSILETPVSFSDAKERFKGRFVLVLDPVYERLRVVGGEIAAVSETDAGIRRAARALAPIPGRFRIERLFV